MIARVKLSENPANLVDYIFSDKSEEYAMKDRAKFLCANYCFGETEEMKKQFLAYLQNPKLKEPAMHIIISLAPNEKLTENQKAELIDMVSEKMGMSNYPFIAVEHLDTDNHQHFHIAISRRSPYEKVSLKDSNSYFKMMDVCRKAEIKFGLRQVAHPYDKNAFRHDERKIKMRSDIIAALHKSTNMARFEAEVQQHGYKVLKQRGIAFVDEKGMKAKGSDKQIGFPLGKIEKILQQNEAKLLGYDNKPSLGNSNEKENSLFDKVTSADSKNSVSDSLIDWMNDISDYANSNKDFREENIPKKKKKEKNTQRRNSRFRR